MSKSSKGKKDNKKDSEEQNPPISNPSFKKPPEQLQSSTPIKFQESVAGTSTELHSSTSSELDESTSSEYSPPKSFATPEALPRLTRAQASTEADPLFVELGPKNIPQPQTSPDLSLIDSSLEDQDTNPTLLPDPSEELSTVSVTCGSTSDIVSEKSPTLTVSLKKLDPSNIGVLIGNSESQKSTEPAVDNISQHSVDENSSNSSNTSYTDENITTLNVNTMPDSEIKEYLDAVPAYDGNSKGLLAYLARCSLLQRNLGEENKDRFVSRVLNKLSDELFLELTRESVPETWQTIKEALLARCSAPIVNSESAHTTLTQVTQNAKESMEQYGIRVTGYLKTLIDAHLLKLDKDSLKLDKQTREAITSINDEIARQAFIRGINNTNIKWVMNAKTFSTLKEAIEEAMTQEKRVEADSKHVNMSKGSSYCSNCKKQGHTNNQCKSTPQEKKSSYDPKKNCNYCNRTGHNESECFTKQRRNGNSNNNSNNSNNSKPGNNQKTCKYCKEPGHLLVDCPKRPENRAQQNNNNRGNSDNNSNNKSNNGHSKVRRQTAKKIAKSNPGPSGNEPQDQEIQSDSEGEGVPFAAKVNTFAQINSTGN